MIIIIFVSGCGHATQSIVIIIAEVAVINIINNNCLTNTFACYRNGVGGTETLVVRSFLLLTVFGARYVSIKLQEK